MAEATSWVGLKDLVLQALTGRLVELSSASGTGMLSIADRTWDPEAVALSGARPGQLPQVLSTTATLPLATHVARQVGLPAGTPVVVGAGDGPLGNLGTGAILPGRRRASPSARAERSDSSSTSRGRIRPVASSATP